MTPAPLSQPHSRRTFLGTGLTVVGGLATAWALPGTAFAAQDETKYFPLVLSPWLYANAEPQRTVLALSHSTSKGIQYASGPSVKIRFRSPDGSWTPLVQTTYDRVGLPKGRGVYVTDATFATPGVWKAEARAGGQRIPFSLEVNAAPKAPVAGDMAPTAPSPTTTDTLGVDPICTRDPECPLHTVSISDVIGQGKPVVVLFATPARCQSQYCAPVLDEFLKVSERPAPRWYRRSTRGISLRNRRCSASTPRGSCARASRARSAAPRCSRRSTPCSSRPPAADAPARDEPASIHTTFAGELTPVREND
jgi:hypothetical protein